MGLGWGGLGLAVTLAMAACGGDDDDVEVGTDGRPTIADAPDASSDAMPASCPPPAFGALGELQEADGFQFSQEFSDPDGPQLRQVTGSLGEEIAFMLQLWDDRGHFTGGAAMIGTYSLGGEKFDVEMCGTCLSLVFGTEKDGIFTVPMAGTLVLDSIDGTVTGSAADLTLQNVDFLGGGIPGECTTTVESLSFSAVLMQE